MPAWLAVCVMAAAPAACATPHSVVISGDARSVRLTNGSDVTGSQAVADHYCAQFDRTARFVEADPDSIYYDCVQR